MEMPTHCPFCRDPLLNEYYEVFRGLQRLRKTCRKRIDHKIEFMSPTNNESEVDFVKIPLTLYSYIMWCPTDKTLTLCRSTAENYNLPYFEPDLSKYHKLINKIKTYLVFS